MASASGQGEVLKKRSVNLFQLNGQEHEKVSILIRHGVRVMCTELGLPVFIDVLDLVDLLLNALTRHPVGLQLIHLLVNQVRDGFVEILQKVLDHLWDDMVGLLLILPLIGKVCFRVTCKEN